MTGSEMNLDELQVLAGALRDEISKRTEMGSIISNAINKGELVPDDTILNIIDLAQQ